MKIFAKELREKKTEEIIQILTDAKASYMQVRQKKHSDQASIQEMKVARENVGRIQTVLHEKKTIELVEKAKACKKIPKELKPKLTRKLRRSLTKNQLKKMNTGKPKVTKKIFTFVA